jgi:ubiquinone/menaquinone biosynthesis C-methylase UbiE
MVNAEFIAWVVGMIEPSSQAAALDVGAGTGHLSRALAPRVKRLVAFDLTPQMLDRNKHLTEEAGLTNVSFQQGDTYALPFPDASFDLVTTQLTVHHFESPERALSEIFRVCRPGRRVGVVDLVSPDEPALAADYNRIERLRDPSHTTALTEAQLTQLVERSGFEVERTASRESNISAGDWLDLSATPKDVRRDVIEEFRQEAHGGPPTGMRAYLENERLMFRQRGVVVVAVKPSI